MRLYDYPDPRHPGRLIRGYDRPHAVRTARMCAAVATRLGHPPARVVTYQIACLLHDLGRAGLDRGLFGKIWSWARRRGVPTRPREWRLAYPATPYGGETRAFLAQYAGALQKVGVPLDDWTREQVEMRLGAARRFARMLRSVKPRLTALDIRWAPWMTRIVLYYYYPEKVEGATPWVRQLAEVLVACEQLEAYNNWRRGRDYYDRRRESLPEAFAYLEKLRVEGMLSGAVLKALRQLAAEGAFDRVLAEARGVPLSSHEVRALRTMSQGGAGCR